MQQSQPVYTKWPQIDDGVRSSMMRQAPDFIAAMQAHKREDFRKMLSCARRLLGISPCSCEPYLVEGLAHLGLGQARKALAAFRAASYYGAQCEDVWRGIALAHTRLDDSQGAAVAIGACVLLAPMNMGRWRDLRKAYAQSGLSEYIPGVDRAVEMLATSANIRIPAHSLYGADYLVWKLYGKPRKPSTDWGDYFEDSADGARPEILALTRGKCPNRGAAAGTGNTASTREEVGVMECYRDLEIWHPVRPWPRALTVLEQRTSLQEIRRLLDRFGLSPGGDPAAGAAILYESSWC